MSALEDALLMQIRMLGLPEPQREFVFAPPRRWRLDFFWKQASLGAEVEGATWVQGRHNRGDGFEKDAEKYNAATIAGIRIVRFTRRMIESGAALATLEKLLKGAP